MIFKMLAARTKSPDNSFYEETKQDVCKKYFSSAIQKSCSFRNPILKSFAKIASCLPRRRYQRQRYRLSVYQNAFHFHLLSDL